MKNFKKVISAVIALALSASTLVSAASFTDVAKTAPYAEAIDVLYSLGIITGYEDGTFKPEGEITRAEAATMIVEALNMGADADNAAGTTQFADVNEKAAWASGYINVGVAQGFINGMGDGTFAPQENVTYAQMCVMLTIISGYGDYAANGGYPTGYTTMAATTGINKGVSVGDNVALTRGQVAQMIYNTLTVPMLGVAEYNLTGNTYAQLDGKGNRDFKTLLSDKFNGYAATILISQTPVANDLDNDEFKFVIQKADWWYDGTNATPYPTAEQDGYFASDVDVNGNNKQIGKAVFVENEDEEPELVYFAATGKTDTKEFDADEYVMQSKLGLANIWKAESTAPDTTKDAANNKIRFGSKYYTVNPSLAIYVNGKSGVTLTAAAGVATWNETPNPDVPATIAYTGTSREALDMYLGNAVGTIKLVDTNTSVDGYDAIFVDIWNVAEVLGVEYENNQTVVTMTTKNTLTGKAAYEEIIIDDENVEEGKVKLTVEKNGEAAELTSIVKGDIIAYKSDLGSSGTTQLRNPAEIEILATDDVVTGKVTSKDTDDETTTIDGTVYEAVLWTDIDTELAMTETYKLTLDPFGRIYDYEQDGSSALYAIALDVTNDDVIKLVLADGTTKSYPIEGNDVISGFTTNTIAGVQSYLNGSVAASGRIVAYKVRNKTGEIMSLAKVTPNEDAWSGGDEYKSRTNRLGSSAITSTTNVIDATKAEGATNADTAASYTKFNVENFKDGTEYKYVSVKTGTFTNLVVIHTVGTKFNTETRFAVVRKGPQSMETEDGDKVEKVIVMTDGDDKKALLFNEGKYTAAGLAVGDAFFYEVDAYGYVENIFTIYDQSTGTFTTLAAALTAAGKTPANYIETDPAKDNGWDYTLLNSARADIQLVEGYVMTYANGAMTFAPKAANLYKVDTKIDLADTDPSTPGDQLNEGVAIFAVTDATKAYQYDINNANIIETYDKFSTKAPSTLASTKLEKYEENGVYGVATTNDNGTPADPSDDYAEYNTVDMAAEANYAIALIIDEVVAQVYVIKK